MSTIPTAVFSVHKMHEYILSQRIESKWDQPMDPSKDINSKSKDFQNEAHNYSTKLMNSIWGRYNLHAPPAFQKNEEVSKLLPSTPNQSSSNRWLKRGLLLRLLDKC